MNSTERKREAIKGAYSGKDWQRRVDHMSQNQVLAIWHNLHLQKKV